MWRVAAIAVALAGCFTPSPGRRDQTTVSNDAKAILSKLVTPRDSGPNKAAFERHYAAAMDAYKHTDFALAIAEFEAAYAIDDQPLLIFNIAQAFRKAGRLDEALRKYREYLDRDPSAERDHVSELIKETERDLAQQPKH